MARIDLKNKAIQAKLVYYGPGLCGKTTNLQYINAHMAGGQELMSLSTEGDRTIFFDFMPLDLGKLRGLDVQFKLYTVPGQVRYNQTRKMVLKNVDGVVFVADSQAAMIDANLESLDNLFSNLKELAIDASLVPIVLQYNKRDLPNVLSVEELDRALNSKRYPTYVAAAASGNGVVETLKAACKHVLVQLAKSLPERDEPEPAPRTVSAASRNGSNRPAAEAGPEPAVAGLAAAAMTTAPASVVVPAEPERDRYAQIGCALGELKQEIEELRRAHASGSTRDGPAVDEALRKLSEQSATKSELVALHKRVDALATQAQMAELAGVVRSIAESQRAQKQPAQPEVATKADIGALRMALERATRPGELDALRGEISRLGGEIEGLRKQLAATDVRQAPASSISRQELGDAIAGAVAGLATREVVDDLWSKLQELSPARRQDLKESIDQAVDGLASRRDLEVLAGKLARSAGTRSAPGDPRLSEAIAAVERALSTQLAALDRRVAELSGASDLRSVHAKLESLLERIESRLESVPGVQSPSEPARSEAAAEPPSAEPASVARAEAEPAPAQKPHVEQAPAEQESAEEASAGPASAEDASAEDASAGEATAETAPAETAPADEAPADEAPADEPEEAPADAAPAEEAPADAAPAEEAPADAAPADGASSDEAPADAAPATASETPAEREQASAEPAEAAASPTAGASEAGPEPAPAAPDTTLDDPAQENAARIARVMVADLYLYNKEQVERGIVQGDFFERNKEALEDMRVTYESRVPAEVRGARDHLTLAIQAFIEKKRKQLAL